jgi:hypothetical protein
MRSDPYTTEELVEIIGNLVRGTQWRDALLSQHMAAADVDYMTPDDDDPGFTALLRDPRRSDAEVGAAYLAMLASRTLKTDPPGCGTDGSVEF